MSAARTGLTKVRTRSHVQTFRKSLQTERHPQKKVGYQAHPLRHTSLKLMGILCGFSPYPPMHPPSSLRLDAMRCDRLAPLVRERQPSQPPSFHQSPRLVCGHDRAHLPSALAPSAQRSPKGRRRRAGLGGLFRPFVRRGQWAEHPASCGVSASGRGRVDPSPVARRKLIMERRFHTAGPNPKFNHAMPGRNAARRSCHSCITRHFRLDTVVDAPH